MGLFNPKEDERFEFEVTLTPRSAGDFGSISIGGCYRSPERCISDFKEIKEGINRHVDGVESLHMMMIDVYEEYEDIAPWYYEQVKKKYAKENDLNVGSVKFSDIKDKFPKKEMPYEDLINEYNWVRKSLTEGKLSVEEILDQMNSNDIPQEDNN